MLGAVLARLAKPRERSQLNLQATMRRGSHAVLVLVLVLVSACAPRAPQRVPTLDIPPAHPAAAPMVEAPAAVASPFEDAHLTPLERQGFVIAERACAGCHALGKTSRRSVAEGNTTGPDLSYEGGKYPNLWHYHHLRDPRSVTPGARMPAFPSLFTEELRDGDAASDEAERQASAIAQGLVAEGVTVGPRAQLIAVIAFLQSLGRDRPARPAMPTKPPMSEAAILALVPQAKVAGELWRDTCAACHGRRGEGLIGPNLTDGAWLHGSRPTEIYTVVADGVVQRGMPGWRAVLGDEKVALLTAYVLAELAGRNLPSGHP